MPIPTKTQPPRHKSEHVDDSRHATASRPTSKRFPDVDSTKAAVVPTTTNEPLKSSSSITRSRIAPRPSPASSATIRQDRPASRIVASNGTLTATSTASVPASSRASSTSSTASRSLPTSVPRTASTIKPKATISQTRVGSNSASIIKPPTTQTSRLRPLSNLPSTTKPISTTRTSSTSTNILPPSNTKSASHPAHSRLHDELYQLQLLHASSQPQLTQYKTSISQHLSTKHAHLQAQQSHLLALEARTNEALNTQVLNSWLSTRSQTHLIPPAAQIQLLSSTVKEIDELSEDSEALEPLRRFDDWVAETLAVRDERAVAANAAVAQKEVVFLTPLEPEWHDRMQGLRQRLGSLVATLGDFGEVDRESGLGKLLARHRTFVETLVQEVDVAVGLERAVMRDEKGYEAELLDKAMGELNVSVQEAGNGRGWQGVWMRPGCS